MKIGVLALQGAFIEHINMLNKLGLETIEIRQKSHLEEKFDALVLPGGESTVMGKLLRELNMFDIIRGKIAEGMPVFGTCAGMILLAKSIQNDEKVHLGTMDIQVVRNAFGRQYDSFNACEKFDNKMVEMPFIRAPYILEVGDKVEVLSTVKGKIVAVRQQNQLAIAFHPELTNNYEVHKYFIKIVEESFKDNKKLVIK